MSTYNKVKGSKFETDVENYGNENGLRCRRLPRSGAKDIGDAAIELNTGIVVLLEAKNVKTPDMAGWLREAAVESVNYENKYGTPAIPAVVQKARGKGIGDARVTLTFDDLINLLKWNNLT